MRIACLGGGPAGLYFAISMKLRDPGTRSSCSSATGPTTPSAGAWCCRTRRWPTSGRPIPSAPRRSAAPSPTGTTSPSSTTACVTASSGHGFCGIGRKRLLSLLQDRARELGVELQVRDRDRRASSTIAATTSSSPPTASTRGARRACARVQARHRHAPRASSSGSARSQKFDDAFTFIFEKTEHGWIWAHAYQFDADTATFIVECTEATWGRFGFDGMSAGGDDRDLRADLRRASRRPSPDVQRRASARLGVDELPPRALRDAGPTRTSC